MAEAGFLEPKRIRPGAATVVVLLHTAAIAALLLAKNPHALPEAFRPTTIIDVAAPPPPPPPPEPLPRIEPQHRQPSVIDTPLPRNPTDSTFRLPPSPPVPPPDLGSRPAAEDVPGTPYVPPRADPIPDPTPPAPPVRVEPRMVSGDLQPPYPSSEQRMEREGSVVIRLTIGADGRVLATEKVRATSDAFYEATERHARARWRFRPATLDGRPIEGRKTLTVNFRLDES